VAATNSPDTRAGGRGYRKTAAVRRVYAPQVNLTSRLPRLATAFTLHPRVEGRRSHQRVRWSRVCAFWSAPAATYAHVKEVLSQRVLVREAAKVRLVKHDACSGGGRDRMGALSATAGTQRGCPSTGQYVVPVSRRSATRTRRLVKPVEAQKDCSGWRRVRWLRASRSPIPAGRRAHSAAIKIAAALAPVYRLTEPHHTTHAQRP
jgi:hypothetical protein